MEMIWKFDFVAWRQLREERNGLVSVRFLLPRVVGPSGAVVVHFGWYNGILYWLTFGPPVSERRGLGFWFLANP